MSIWIKFATCFANEFIYLVDDIHPFSISTWKYVYEV